MQPNNNDLINAYNDAVQRLGNVLDLLYIMNFYYSPLFIRIAEDDFWPFLHAMIAGTMSTSTATTKCGGLCSTKSSCGVA